MLVVNERSILGESSAFKNRAIGPFKIVGKFNDDLNYKIMALNNDRVQTIHYNRLLYYKARNPDELSFGVNKPSMKHRTKIQIQDKEKIQLDSNSNVFDVDVAMFLAYQDEQNEKNTDAGNGFEETPVVEIVSFEAAENVIETPINYRCEFCPDKIYTSNKWYQRHMNKYHANQMMENIQAAIEFVVNEVVDLSDHEFAGSVSNLEENNSNLSNSDNSSTSKKKTKKGRKYVNCNTCQKRFTKKGLHVHMRKHSKEAVKDIGISLSVEGDVNGSE